MAERLEPSDSILILRVRGMCVEHPLLRGQASKITRSPQTLNTGRDCPSLANWTPSNAWEVAPGETQRPPLGRHTEGSPQRGQMDGRRPSARYGKWSSLAIKRREVQGVGAVRSSTKASSHMQPLNFGPSYRNLLLSTAGRSKDRQCITEVVNGFQSSGARCRARS